MRHKFTHVDLREEDTTESFFSHHFLSARIKTGHESNEGFDPIFTEGRTEEWLEAHWKEIKDNDLKYEEDVNQYITLTLSELVNPRSLAHLNEYLIDINSDAGRIALSLNSKSNKYYLFRVNADFLLLNLGLFRSDLFPDSDAYVDKGGSYYFSAATSLKSLQGGRTGLSDVMEKLSVNFGKYVEILRQMKQDADNYLSFHTHIPEAEIKKLEEQLTLEVKKKKGTDSD
ncbi:hypothetical protein [Nitrospina watsonii]|uniref:Uncharacterized protein n=1 Tax=Nitrospina watsonii TaxID=1323948 RepID=A0ABN8VZG9_9BACT|nr:hypothetical protein [Nitrospina watsonii]CAI2719150.1 conserved protein of unknown function [Nitrospina watsonii]